MGITFIQKSTRGNRPPDPQIALVLAGGAVTGGAFKLGGLVALDDILSSRKIVDFDIYVGLSAGALLAAPLAAGIPPAQLMAALGAEGEAWRACQMRAAAKMALVSRDASDKLRRAMLRNAPKILEEYLPGMRG